MRIEPFDERYRRALDDPELRATLLQFQRTWRAGRDARLSEPEFDRSRRRLADIKDGVIADLPAYVERFAESARTTGASVHRATDGDEAASTVIQIAAAHGATRVVKSKSMLTEEIGLNERLETAGLHVTETDLGEWIVQLAGERPSHIVGPALHKNRRQVAELFERATGKSVSRDDIAEQVAVARAALREEFLAGQMGISGANALIAESGTIMLVTNEGNAELVTSVPPVHIVIAGIEKILPSMEDALLQLELLVPTATGQPVTSYVTFITGPETPDTALHIILVDNGRTAMRDRPEFADALRCIRCGACSSVCPSYGAIGGHVFGYIYSGAIGLVNTPFHHGLEHDAGPQSLCVSCNACQSVCPVDIPLPRQILDTRAEVVARSGMPLMQRGALAVFSRPSLFRALVRSGIRMQFPIRRGEFIRPPFLRRLTSWRALPALAPRPFRDQAAPPELHPLEGPLGEVLRGVRVAIFTQCITDWLYPNMAEAIRDSLRLLGAQVSVPANQHCCGLPALDSGSKHLARRMARQTIEALEACGADYIVSGGTSCVVAMLHEYPHLFVGEPEWRARAESLASRVRDFTTFMDQIAHLPPGCLANRREAGTYHYFCQSYNVLGFRQQPLRLLSEVCGVRLAPLPEANVCCGFGGSVSAARPEMCRHILGRKLENLDTTGATLLITDNPGCIMHLRGGIDASGRPVRVRHTAEIVAERLRRIAQNDGGHAE